MTKKRIICTNCIHSKVCGRFQFAKKYKEENDNSFRANSIADICQDFLLDNILRENKQLDVRK